MEIETSLMKHVLSDLENIPIGWIPELYSKVGSILPSRPVVVYEFRFGNLGDDNDAYDKAVSKRCRLLHSISRVFKLTFFRTNLLPDTSSKVRSYKGVFPVHGDIYNSGYEQIEVFRGERISTLVGATAVSEANLSECCKLAFDPRTAFFLMDQRSSMTLDADFAASIFSQTQPTHIDLPYLLHGIGEKFSGLIVFGGDNGVSYLNLSAYSTCEAAGSFSDLVY